MLGNPGPQQVAAWCRSLGDSLEAGVDLLRALERARGRGPAALRAVSGRLRDRIGAGADFSAAIGPEEHRLPGVVVAMTSVAARTGHLPEVLKELAGYLEFQHRLRQRFLAQIAWPLFQLVAAILVIALVIYLLGVIGQAQGGQGMDLLGLGLQGAGGAAIWLSLWFAAAAGSVGAYQLARRGLRGSLLVDSLLLRVPVVGAALRTLSLSRLCFALHLTLDSSLSVLEAVPLSLAATGNGVFQSLGPRMVRVLRAGQKLSQVFGKHSLFPEQFLDALAAGEESGRIPESMRRLSRQYDDQVAIHLAALNRAAGILVWCFVAGVILFFVLRLWMNYVALLNELSI